MNDLPRTAQSLLKRNHPLSSSDTQLRVLEGNGLPSVRPFRETLAQNGIDSLRAHRIGILQVNVGRLCNQVCSHCHVDAGPDRREIMNRDTAELVVRVLAENRIPALDLTGGAPEMNPHFRYLVESAASIGTRVIDRCNLTILTVKGHEETAGFLAAHNVEVVASLPCYLESNCDSQRGEGVYRKSIEALKKLNSLGYGSAPERVLSLVYNPVSASLPPNQSKLENDYRRELMDRHGIVFTNLYSITNMPIARYLEYLIETNQYESYMQKLLAAFNPAAVDGLMCRETISVDWKGNLYDCDFNQMLGLRVDDKSPQHLGDFSVERLANRPIVTGRHCYGCTAGAGSSCQGAIT